MMRDEQSQASRHPHEYQALRALEQREYPRWPVHPLPRLFESIAGEFQRVGHDAGDAKQRCAAQDDKFRPGENEHTVSPLEPAPLGIITASTNCYRASRTVLSRGATAPLSATCKPRLPSLLEQDGAGGGLDGQQRQRWLADTGACLAAAGCVADGDVGKIGVDPAADGARVQAKGAVLRQGQADFAVGILKLGARAVVERPVKVDRPRLRLHP